METVIIFIIFPIIGIIFLTISDSAKPSALSSLTLELITFIGGWISTISLALFGFRFIEYTEWGLGNIFYFFVFVIPTVIFFPGMYYFIKQCSDNRIIVSIGSILLSPLLTVSIWGVIILFGGPINQQ